ncbi:3,4-dihydroxy-2-butanone 4-phosphate synthase [Agrobacterium tumefaciens]|nr:3,4-dihydroxy-2-butanone 4-phosphate synthase [Agrobacterium tumefaciens]KAJ32566.1 hypothetical protein BW45_19515 [Agrobacterium tumefaciens]
MPISTIEAAIESIKRGEMVVVVDDEHRENEGDLIIAADAVTTEHIAFMMKNARGLICIAMEGRRLDELDIPLMVEENTDSMRTAFTVSVDLIEGNTTGISASDRANTLNALIDPLSSSTDFSRPGHIFPLRAHPGGLKVRAGHTEAAVQIARLAGRSAAGVICEIANDDGSMARLPELEVFATEHNLHIVTIADLIEYCRSADSLPAAA